jgi:hypothetical protein
MNPKILNCAAVSDEIRELSVIFVRRRLIKQYNRQSMLAFDIVPGTQTVASMLSNQPLTINMGVTPAIIEKGSQEH